MRRGRIKITVLSGNTINDGKTLRKNVLIHLKNIINKKIIIAASDHA